MEIYKNAELYFDRTLNYLYYILMDDEAMKTLWLMLEKFVGFSP